MSGAAASEHHIVKTSLIIGFSLAMVLLGAHELHKKHFARVRSKVADPKELISELRGDPDLKVLFSKRENLSVENKARREKESKTEHTETFKASVEKLVP